MITWVVYTISTQSIKAGMPLFRPKTTMFISEFVFLPMTTSSTITEPPVSAPDPAPSVTIILTFLLLSMFFVGFFSIYFCRCFMDYIANFLNNRHNNNTSGTPINPTPISLGLDSSIVNTFPTFPYSSVKDYQCEKYGLECAICLCEFDDDNILRLLSICCHVFHKECIDLWFESHKSCPVCRTNLDEQSPGKGDNGSVHRTPGTRLDNEPSDRGNDVVGSITDAVSVAIRDDTKDEEGEGGTSVDELGRKNLCVNYDKFSRSHSTGHSILQHLAIEDDAKYKLRLPDHIKESITRRHNVTLSCTTFGYISSAENHKCFGEISGCGDINKV